MRSLRRFSRCACLGAISVVLVISLPGAAEAQLGPNIDPCDHIESADPLVPCQPAHLLNGGARSLNIVIVGDGFTQAQLGAYREAADEFVEQLLNTHPLGALSDAFSVYRLDVISPDAGIDRFVGSGCGFDPALLRNTALETGICGGLNAGGNGSQSSVRRLVNTANGTRLLEFTAQAGVMEDHVLVLVNNGLVLAGGAYFASARAFSSLIRSIDPSGVVTDYSPNREDWARMAIHEMGHGLFNLEDEYCGTGVGAPCSFDPTDETSEPARANVTIETNLAQLKWRQLVQPNPPALWPSEQVAACGGNGATFGGPADTVGLFEGANKESCGIYRPQAHCRMRETTAEPFCAVCRQRILWKLKDHIAGPLLFVLEKGTLPHHELLRAELILRRLEELGLLKGPDWPPGPTVPANTGDTLATQLGTVIDWLAGSEVPRLSLRDGEVEVNVYDPPPHTVGSQIGDGGAAFSAPGFAATALFVDGSMRFLLDTLYVKEQSGSGFQRHYAKIEYAIRSGTTTIEGTWPATGWKSIKLGGPFVNTPLRLEASAGGIPVPPTSGDLEVDVKVLMLDWQGVQELGNDTFSFGSAADFGAGEIVHVRDRPKYRITFSIVKPQK